MVGARPRSISDRPRNAWQDARWDDDRAGPVRPRNAGERRPHMVVSLQTPLGQRTIERAGVSRWTVGVAPHIAVVEVGTATVGTRC